MRSPPGSPRRTWSAAAALAVAACLAACGDAVATDGAPVAGVDLTPPVATLETGRTLALAATPRDAMGAALAGRLLRWSSSDPLVASVSEGGLVTARAPGSARIAASAGGRSATTAITVTVREVASLQLAPLTLTLRVARTAPLVARPLDADGQLLAERPVTFTTSDPAVATVSAQGVVTAVAPGAAVVTATSGGRSGQAAVTVTPEPVASVQVRPVRDTVPIGNTVTFVAELRDEAGGTLTGRVVTWSTTDAAIATVSSTGVVTARALGSATISAVSEGRVGQASVIVVARLADAITLTPNEASLAEGDTLALLAQLTAPDGTLLSDRVVTFASDAPAIASVTPRGVVTARAAGVAVITATSEGRRATARITVVPVPVAQVAVTPASVELLVGATRSLVADVRAASGATLAGRAVSWTSGAPLVASVSASGGVTALAPGVAVIVATSEGVSGFALVTVRTPAVASVTLAPASATVPVNGTAQLTVTVRDADGRALSGRAVTWSSNDEEIAFVSSTGLVTGVRTGTATIFATVEGVRGSTLVIVP